VLPNGGYSFYTLTPEREKNWQTNSLSPHNKLGLRHPGGEPVSMYNTDFASLASLNDHGYSFIVIANILELDLNGQLTLEKYRELIL
jgi:hypothetical protein